MRDDAPRGSFSEWWIPMQRTMPLRAAPRLTPVLLLLIALVLAAVAAIALVGSRPRLPDPFGLATNGQIAYLSNGQIYVANPNGSNPMPITLGSRSASTPTWSRDGTRVAYKLIASGAAGEYANLHGDLIVVARRRLRPDHHRPRRRRFEPRHLVARRPPRSCTRGSWMAPTRSSSLLPTGRARRCRSVTPAPSTGRRCSRRTGRRSRISWMTTGWRS